MRKFAMIHGVVFAVIVFTLLWVTGTPCLAQEIDPEIMDMLRRHDQALSEQDLATVMATYAPEGTIVLMGTGPGERWVGKEEIEDAYMHFFQDFDPGSLRTECTWHSLDTQGTISWLMIMCHFTDYLKNQKRDYALNISAVLEKQEDQWYFRTFHFSNLTGGE
jgi:uncharacterized protein (TIGR02246 family)